MPPSERSVRLSTRRHKACNRLDHQNLCFSLPGSAWNRPGHPGNLEHVRPLCPGRASIFKSGPFPWILEEMPARLEHSLELANLTDLGQTPETAGGASPKPFAGSGLPLYG